MKDIKVNIQGNYSNIHYREERIIIEHNDIYHTFKTNKYSKKVIRYDNCNLIQTSKDVRYNNSFIGSTCEIEGGFIPTNNIVHYFKNRIYRTRRDAENYLIHKHFERYRKVFFGLFAKQQFFYSKNHIKNSTINDLVRYSLYQFPDVGLTYKERLKIAKKYLKTNVINYQGQGGYISNKENIINTTTI